MTIPTKTTPAEAAALPFPPGRLSTLAIETPDIQVRHYEPKGTDTQVPHDQDELYFVISGTGQFERSGARVSFKAGDMLFVAAYETHRFVDFSGDFATWVLFYGPKKKV
jgi:mannose-6-phosphate isomerase-like protein (cupin superfamily)